MKFIGVLFLLSMFFGAPTLMAAEHDNSQESEHENDEHKPGDTDHDDDDEESDHHDESEEGVVELSDESIRQAGIKIQVLRPELLPTLISAPGEVQLDQYSSAEVTPLIDAVVVKRYAQLGNEVVVGQAMVTLASVDVAAAQGELTIASMEWERVRELGASTVSAKRYVQAEVSYEQARLKLGAYGLDDKQIAIAANPERKGNLGQFDLNAPIAGTVLRDEFRIGQRVEAGHSLFLIADESRIWVEANLSPIQAKDIQIGMQVRINMGGHWHDGSVIQKHHLLDEKTRTVPIRIAVKPSGEHHHAGEFVQVAIAVNSASDDSTLVVTESALMRDDEGYWTVFVEVKPGHFKQTRVSRGESQGRKVPITGITSDLAVVTYGAFFLAAELAKGGFDIHNH